MSMKSLAKGRYKVRCKEANAIAAALNGHGAIWPDAEAVSDGEWVRFFRGDKEVFSCNSTYAAHNFDVRNIQAGRGVKTTVRR